MKTISNLKMFSYCFFTIILLFCFTSVNADSRYWVANSTAYWNNQANWSTNNGGNGGASVPTTGDNIYFNDNGQGNCILADNVNIKKLTIDDYNGIINLSGKILTCSGKVKLYTGIIDDSDGSGLLLINSSSSTYFKGTIINSKVSVVSEKIYFHGSVFNNIAEFEQTGNSSSNSDGGNTFNAHTTIIKSGKGTMVFAKKDHDIYNADVIFSNLHTNYINISDKTGTSVFNGKVYLNSDNSGGIKFGYHGGNSIFSATSSMLIGSVGFNKGYLMLKNVTFNSNDSVSLYLTGSARLKIYDGTTFNGTVNLKIPRIILNNTSFNDNLTIEKTGNKNDVSYGGNIFEGDLTIINNSSGYIRLTNSGSAIDHFKGNTSFIKNNTGYIYIANKGISIFEGNLNIKGTGDNKIYIGLSGGIVAFNGSQDQTINNLSDSIPLPYFRRMEINKSNGNLILNTSVKIYNKLTFNYGDIISDTVNILVFRNNAVVEQASEYSHVVGAVEKDGNDKFTFPLGTGSIYKPISISEPSSGNTKFIAEYKNVDPLSIYSNQNIEASIDHISSVEYWKLKRYNSSSKVEITLHWDLESGGVNNINDLTVVGWDGNQWKNYGRNDINGDTLSGLITSLTKPFTYKGFALGSTSFNNSLPIELLYFNTQCGNDTVVILTWATASEINNDYFTIFKSLDCIEWLPITTIQGSGNSSTLKEYMYKDRELKGEDARYFYKMRQTDFDGNYKEYKMETVFCRQNLKKIKIYPNPVNSYFNLQFNNVYNIDSPLDILLYNVSGKIVRKFSHEVTAGQISLNVNLPDLPSGTYYLQVKLGTIYFYTSPIVIEK